MSADRLSELERQVAALLRGDVAVAARADGVSVVTADSTARGRAVKVILSELRRDVPYDSCSIQELRDDRLVIIGGVGFSTLDVILGENFEIDNADVPNGEVVHRRRPLIVGDTENYRAFRRGLHVGANIRSWLGVPMLDGRRLLGVLALDKTEPDFYTNEHASVALTYAALTARALLAGEEQANYA
jgi:signal transduction protein with GAF and PtsI domain